MDSNINHDSVSTDASASASNSSDFMDPENSESGSWGTIATEPWALESQVSSNVSLSQSQDWTSTGIPSLNDSLDSSKVYNSSSIASSTPEPSPTFQLITSTQAPGSTQVLEPVSASAAAESSFRQTPITLSRLAIIPVSVAAATASLILGFFLVRVIRRKKQTARTKRTIHTTSGLDFSDFDERDDDYDSFHNDFKKQNLDMSSKEIHRLEAPTKTGLALRSSQQTFLTVYSTPDTDELPNETDFAQAI
ncbi:hypothetical protein PPACK8108_LOCUS25817 [Phakopsora pachyrhizi]|uniref:Uncharacterized protein n=1 Tax=Phakopsora pachyrhizi TaxID=170000 RepID=A0AAV0BTJ7_PHAPC|nr:hypothetical protein PPACK8108_LOCUS25817 [Phakopsora pachyrhizi]